MIHRKTLDAIFKILQGENFNRRTLGIFLWYLYEKNPEEFDKWIVKFIGQALETR